MEYLYRDASNYKAYNYVILPGRITKAQIEEIMACLPDGENFIPSDVGLPEIRFGEYTEDDVPWFELSKDGFSDADEEPTISITPQELVDRFRAQKEKWSKEIF